MLTVLIIGIIWTVVLGVLAARESLAEGRRQRGHQS